MVFEMPAISIRPVTAAVIFALRLRSLFICMQVMVLPVLKEAEREGEGAGERRCNAMQETQTIILYADGLRSSRWPGCEVHHASGEPGLHQRAGSVPPRLGSSQRSLSL